MVWQMLGRNMKSLPRPLRRLPMLLLCAQAARATAEAPAFLTAGAQGPGQRNDNVAILGPLQNRQGQNGGYD